MFPELLRVLRILSMPCAGPWGSRLVSRLGASCHLSPESVTWRRKHAEHLGCDAAVIPCLQLLAGKALCHARPGLGAFPRQWHRGRASRSRVWVWDGRVNSLCATSRLLGELLHVSWTVVLVAMLWVWRSPCSVLLGIYLKSQELLCLRGQHFDKKHNFRPHAQPVWICMVLLAFCRFIKLCSCSYSCFDFRHFQCRLFTNWMGKRTIID